MGIIESTAAKDAASKPQPPKENFPYFFYDVYKNSVGLITGNDVKRLAKRQPAQPEEEEEYSAGETGPISPVPTRPSPRTLFGDSALTTHGPIPPSSRAPYLGKAKNGCIIARKSDSNSTFTHSHLPGLEKGSMKRTGENNGATNNNNDQLLEKTLWKVEQPPAASTLLRLAGKNDENCNYTCHQECSSLVTLNCKTQTTELGHEFFEVKCENLDSPLFSDPPNGLELKQKIEKYNSSELGYEMELQEDGKTFHGFIRVHMNLTRPINVLAGTRPPSIYDIIYEEEDNNEKTLTSFYLPRDTVKALHVTSETTTQELIRALLQKFKVVDNPRKFCLYEKYWECEGSMKGVLRRMLDEEKPLWLVLAWGIDGIKQRKLVLQENDTGDILWDAFTVPELSNFLRILDREEEEYLNQVRLKYKKIQEKLTEAMDCYEPPRPPEPYEDPFTNM